MKINQSEDAKTEDITKSVSVVSIEINEEKYKEKMNRQESDSSQFQLQDYLITIKKLPLLNIKYFKFGKTLHFFFCLKKTKYRLSEMPTSLFTLGPECKFIQYFLYKITILFVVQFLFLFL